jgi:hypothetical protein
MTAGAGAAAATDTAVAVAVGTSVTAAAEVKPLCTSIGEAMVVGFGVMVTQPTAVTNVVAPGQKRWRRQWRTPYLKVGGASVARFVVVAAVVWSDCELR